MFTFRISCVAILYLAKSHRLYFVKAALDKDYKLIFECKEYLVVGGVCRWLGCGHQSVSQMCQMSQKTHWAHNLISFNQVKTF